MIKSYLYNLMQVSLPPKLKEALINSKLLTPIRQAVISKNFDTVVVDREYNSHPVHFKFKAPFSIARKAHVKGIENIIIRSISQLIDTFEIKGEIVEVGTNFGYLTLSWALMYPQRKVIGFEVHPKIYKTLNESIDKNGIRNIVLNNVPVNNCEEMLEFNLEDRSSKLNAASITDLHRVQSVTLDQAIAGPIAAIKIDTDGNDFACLEGAVEILEHRRPVLVIETNGDNKIIDFLSSYKYNLLDMQLNKINVLDYDISTKDMCNVFAVPVEYDLSKIVKQTK